MQMVQSIFMCSVAQECFLCREVRFLDTEQGDFFFLHFSDLDAS